MRVDTGIAAGYARDVRRLLVLAFAVALAVVAVAASANAHRGVFVRAEVAKHKAGPWKHGAHVQIPTGEAKNVYLRIKNVTSPAQSLDVTLTEGTDGGLPDYRHTWFKGFKGDTDISHDVQTSGYDFTLRHGKTKRFRVRVKAIDGSNPECLLAQWEAQPGGFTDNPIVVNGDSGSCVI
jgi:hypothetical protein